MRSVLVSASKIDSYITVYNIDHSIFLQRSASPGSRGQTLSRRVRTEAALKRASYLVSTGAHYVKA